MCGWLQIGSYCTLSLLEFICQGHLQYLLARWNVTLNKKFFSYFSSGFFIWDDCRRVRYQIKIYLDHPKPLTRRSWVPCLSLLQLPVFRHSRWNISIKMIPKLPPTLSSSDNHLSWYCLLSKPRTGRTKKQGWTRVKSLNTQATAQAEPSHSHKFKERDMVSAVSFV